MSRYSLKKAYKKLITESVYMDPVEDGLYTGKLSKEAMIFFDCKDGSGGRGEFSIVYDILTEGGKIQLTAQEKANLKKFQKSLLKAEKNKIRDFRDFVNKNQAYTKVTHRNRNRIAELLYDNKIQDIINEFKYKSIINDLSPNEVDDLKFNVIDFLSNLDDNTTHDEACEKIKEKLIEIDINNLTGDNKDFNFSFIYTRKDKPVIDSKNDIIDALSSYDSNLKQFAKGIDNKGVSGSNRSISGGNGQVVASKINRLFSIIYINNLIVRRNKDIIDKKKRNINLGDEKFSWAMLASVTASGTGSKSTDINIDKFYLTPSQISSFKVNESLTIECKEIKGLSHIFKQGIRLGGGSRESLFVWSDFVFALSVFSIALNLSDDTTQGTVRNLLYKVKKGEIGKDDFISLIRQFSGLGKSGNIKDFLNQMSNITHTVTNPIKKDIANKCVELLRDTFSNIQDPDEISNLVDQELRSVINKSINAEWFMLIWGNDEELNKRDKNIQTKYIKKGSYVLIHKSKFEEYLTTSKISNSGIAYASLAPSKGGYEDGNNIYDIVRDNLTESYSRGKSKKSLPLLNENRIVLSKRESLIKEITKLSGIKYKIINEGGLAGHMSYLYEVLESTPRDLINKVKSHGVPQSIVEKVDGQNLFLTIKKDGEVMFARNKKDMTHQDLIDKFTGHAGAEKPFVEGGNAIKNAVQSWVNSERDFVLNDISNIFHIADGTGVEPSQYFQSFINFEIMHPESPNQIVYDKKYIVFHSIVDYTYNDKGEREEVMSSNTDRRLKDLFNSLRPHFDGTGFTLASNRSVNLNKLTNVQILSYIERIKEVTRMLDIEGDKETLSDGIMYKIDDELKSEGINLNPEAYKVFRDFVIYGKNIEGTNIKSKDFTSLIPKERKDDVKKLRDLNLTNSSKVKRKVTKILSSFKSIFTDLGVDLLAGVKSAYMSDDMNQYNIDLIRDKLKVAIEDFDDYMSYTPEEEINNTALRLIPYVQNIKSKGIEKTISSAVEGGVYNIDSIGMDLGKDTGGFGPMNQVVGAAMRDPNGVIFSKFQEKYGDKRFKNESAKKSLKRIYKNLF